MNRLRILLLAGCLAFPLAADAAETRIIHSPSSLPSGATVGGGAGVDRATLGGVLYVSTDALGNVGAPETNMMAYTLPANTLDKDGKVLRIIAFGTSAANTNDKTVKCYFGATNTKTMNWTTASLDWGSEIFVIRSGPSTQRVWARPYIAAVAPDVAYSTPAEDTGAAITIKCTGDATSDNDLVQRALIVEVLN